MALPGRAGGEDKQQEGVTALREVTTFVTVTIASMRTALNPTSAKEGNAPNPKALSLHYAGDRKQPATEVLDHRRQQFADIISLISW